MENRNIDGIIAKIKRIVDSHKLDEGKYARWIWQNDKGSRNLGVNEYGCADAANILYTIGEFIGAPGERAACIKTLQDMQDPESGMFCEATHQPLHTTAHCIAALELFDAKPLYPVKVVERYKDVQEMTGLLAGLDWANHPWTESHNGAGLWAIMNLTGMTDSTWNDAYFNWLWEATDAETGLIGKALAEKCGVKDFEYMAGTFHYLFNHEYARMPLRYPEKLIDSCLWMYENLEAGELGTGFYTKAAFIQVDWVYCISRALRQCSYRHDECMVALKNFADKYIDHLMAIDMEKADDFNDLHLLFGAVCCLAELQQTLKGYMRSTKPLKLVLDRRPFI